MSSLTCKLPVLPRVRKYLLVHYPGRINLTAHDPRLAQLWSMFQIEKTQISEISARVAKRPTEQITVQISQYHTSRAALAGPLNAREVRMINVLFDAYLYGEFAQLARQMGQTGGTARQAAQQFCDRYDFSSDELSEDTLKRAWNRQQNSAQAGLVGFEDHLVNQVFQC